MRANGSANAYGIKLGHGNGVIANKGNVEVEAAATATFLSGNDWTATNISDASAAGISTGNGTHRIYNDGRIAATATADNGRSNPNDQSFTVTLEGTNTASAEVFGIQTGNGDTRVFLDTNSQIIGDAYAHTVSAGGCANASGIGVDAGDGANRIFNDGTIGLVANAGSDAGMVFNFGGILEDMPITWPATAKAEAIGIKTGKDDDRIKNHGDINVTADSNSTWFEALPINFVLKTADAAGVGIDAGDGDNFVKNYGNINVTATAAAGTQLDSDGVSIAKAIGIKTGDDNDTIINHGSITVTEIANGVTTPGTAIDAGAGDDTVLMGDASVANGNINLGADDDTLHLFGTPVLAGSAWGGGGTDSLVFDGAGSFTRPLQGFEVATKKGRGTYSVPSLSTMQRLEVNKGTLQINSDYQMSGASTFQARVKGDGTSGQLQVGGTATVDGSLVVVRDRGHYLDGTTYDVLTANQVKNAFASENLPDPTPLLSFSVEQQPTAVQVQASVNSFKSVAGQGNEVGGAVAQCLDKILPTATGDLSEMLGSLQSLPSESDIESVVASLSPTSYDSFTKSVLATVESYVGATHDRMAAVRAKVGPRDLEGRAMFLPGDQPISFAHTKAGLLQPDTSLGAWSVNFNDNGGRAGLGSGYQGFDYDTYGVDMGFDHPLGERSIMGTSFASTFTDLDFDSGLGRGEIDSYLTSIYGTHFLDDRTYVESVLSFGHSESNNIRRVGAGSMQRTAYSTHDGDVVSAFLETGRAFGAGAWRSEVFGSLHYASLDEEEFEETGAGGIDLIVEDRRTESLVSELGLRVGRPIETNLGLLMPQLSIAWAHDFNVDDRKITARFADSPSTAFTVKGSDIESDAVRLGGFLTLTGSNELAVSAGFNAELRENSSDVSGLIKLQFRF